MFEDYYKILGVDKNADAETIKQKYRQLAKKYHPDKNRSAGDIFKRISEAYTVLSDPEKRSEYNLKWEYYQFQDTLESINWERGTSGSEYHPGKESSIYDFRKREYTPKAWMYGRIVIILIIMSALLIPYGIYYYSSVFYYKEGLALEASGNYVDAYNSYIKSMSRWGARNLESCYRAGLIQLNRGSSRESIPFFLSCYDYTNSDSVETWLHYKTAIAYSNIGEYTNALEELNSINNNSFLGDSARLLTAEIRIFRAKEYQRGIQDYEYLIGRNFELKQSWFGIGWGHQNLWDYKAAISAYTECLEIDPEYSLAYFYRGYAYHYEMDSINACMDFMQAEKFGYPSARDAFLEKCADSLKFFSPPTENEF